MRHDIKKIILIAAIPAIGIGWALFRPDLLVVNNTVNEKLTVSNPQALENVSKGKFQSYSHETSGTAEVLKLDGKWILRFSDFKTSNGPDVRVIVGTYSDPKTFTEAESFDLGIIKGNIGDQNYELPASLSPEDLKSVTIWCKRFSVSFGGATLESAKPRVQAQNGFQTISFAEEIRVTSGKLKSGTAELIESNNKRLLRLTNVTLPKVKTADVYLIKAESTSTKSDFQKLTKIKLGQWSSGKKKQEFGVAKDLDLWLYRSIIFYNPTTKQTLGTINLRSDQELRPNLNLS